MPSRTLLPNVFACAFLSASLTGGALPKLPAQPALVSCKPIAQKTSDLGCWITASQPQGVLTGPVYWTLDTFATRALAEGQQTPGSTVVESLGKVWLFRIGPRLSAPAQGTRVAEIGPLLVEAGQSYTAQYSEATMDPGMVSRTHMHAGLEVFYTESGETCLETPEGKQISKPGVNLIVPAGVSMELTATGTQQRRGIVLILHDSSMPPTTVVESWKAKGLCKATGQP